MLKKISKWFTAVLFIPLISCDSTIPPPKVITVSILPQRYFVDVISNQTFIVNVMVPVGASPETYEPISHQMQAMASSMAYLYIGDLGFESGLMPKISEINNRLPIFNCSQGIDLIEGTHYISHDGQDHNHKGTDPHIWTSPGSAKIMARNIANALMQIDPENKDMYQENLDALILKMDSTQQGIKEKLANLKSRKFIIFHPALSYFAKEFDLEQIAIEFEGKNPTAYQIADLVDRAKKDSVQIVIIQKEFDVENAQVISNEIKSKIVQLNTLEQDWFVMMDKLPRLLLGEISE